MLHACETLHRGHSHTAMDTRVFFRLFLPGKARFLLSGCVCAFFAAAFPGFGTLCTTRAVHGPITRNASFVFRARTQKAYRPKKAAYARSSSAASENTANTQLPLPVIIAKLAPYSIHSSRSVPTSGHRAAPAGKRELPAALKYASRSPASSAAAAVPISGVTAGRSWYFA